MREMVDVDEGEVLGEVHGDASRAASETEPPHGLGDEVDDGDGLPA